ncbi:MAG: YqgE/AlgH family protein [Chitinophagales bacterium]|nr:YqgE/AlgH family protein [Chitinophagales bacterium]
MMEEHKNIQIGDIILAEPFMEDTDFKRSVVLLCDHDDENGTIGFIVNKGTKLKLNDVLEDFPFFDVAVNIGGPVQQDTLHFIHNIGPKLDGGIEVVDGIYWGGNYETLKIMIENNEVSPENFKFFLGYSGWSVGQLEEEMGEKSWILSTPKQPHILPKLEGKTNGNLWKQILIEMGGKYKQIANFPEHPSLN